MLIFGHSAANLVRSVFNGHGFLAITALASLGSIGTILIMRAVIIEGFPIRGLVEYCAGGVFLLRSVKIVAKAYGDECPRYILKIH